MYEYGRAIYEWRMDVFFFVFHVVNLHMWVQCLNSHIVQCVMGCDKRIFARIYCTYFSWFHGICIGHISTDRPANR